MTNFPVGYHKFHPKEAINFQMNRWYSSGCIDYETLVAIGKKATGFAQWVKTFLDLSMEFHKEGNYITAATCLRAAQFYTLGEQRDESGHLLKVVLYERCMEEYNLAYKNAGLTYERVPFENGYLPVLYRKHESNSKGVVVMHGGYDSFIQEFIPYMQYIYENGYDVYMFEGCGQGEVLNRCNIKMRPEWEECTSPILDYFALTDVTLIGISLGGYLAARAAAHDRRIQRVVLFDLIYDFYGALLQKIPQPFRKIVQTLMKDPKNPLWKPAEKIIFKNPFGKWLFEQGRYVYGDIHSFYDYLNCIKAYNTKEISAQLKQDVLVMAGSDDMYTVFFDAQMQALRNAKSVNGRIFTEKDHASHHCQIGNIKLALDYILEWHESLA